MRTFGFGHKGKKKHCKFNFMLSMHWLARDSSILPTWAMYFSKNWKGTWSVTTKRNKARWLDTFETKDKALQEDSCCPALCWIMECHGNLHRKNSDSQPVSPSNRSWVISTSELFWAVLFHTPTQSTSGSVLETGVVLEYVDYCEISISFAAIISIWPNKSVPALFSA